LAFLLLFLIIAVCRICVRARIKPAKANMYLLAVQARNLFLY
jgi:hypothetical protein